MQADKAEVFVMYIHSTCTTFCISRLLKGDM